MAERKGFLAWPREQEVKFTHKIAPWWLRVFAGSALLASSIAAPYVGPSVSAFAGEVAFFTGTSYVGDQALDRLVIDRSGAITERVTGEKRSIFNDFKRAFWPTKSMARATF